ncbi:MAG: DinB family protein [Planctomycetota bacterium]|jgi:hypothetical protein
MKTHLIEVSRLNAQYAEANLADIPDDRMCYRPNDGMNHPAWLVGHIVFSYEGMVSMLGGESKLPEGWKELFDTFEMADEPERYPSKQQLTDALKDAHRRLETLVEAVSPVVLERPIEDENFKEVFPRVGDLLTGIMTIHEAVHLGQLSAWRGALGMELPI